MAPPGLLFVPFARACASPATVLCVDCTHPQARSLTHHRGGNAPSELCGDTSTAIVLAGVAAQHVFLTQALEVCANHFDADGLGAVFAAAYPEEALRRRALLDACASLGDFRALDLSSAHGRAALHWNVWVNSAERALFWRPFDVGAAAEAHDSASKYAHFLPRCAAALDAAEAAAKGVAGADAVLRADAPAEYDAELARVLADAAALAAHGSVERRRDLGLAIVSAPHPLHYYALMSESAASGLDVVLSIAPGQRYELEQRYTGFVNLTTRRVLPRVSLQPLARALTQAEAAAGGTGTWVAETFTEAGPLLRLQPPDAARLSKADRYSHPYERNIARSAIPERAFVAAAVSFLEHGLAGVEPRERWSWEALHEHNASIDWKVWRERLPALLEACEKSA